MRNKLKLFCLIIAVVNVTGCASAGLFVKRHRDNPDDFIEKRVPRENAAVSSGTASKGIVLQNAKATPNIKQKSFSRKMLNIAKPVE